MVVVVGGGGDAGGGGGGGDDDHDDDDMTMETVFGLYFLHETLSSFRWLAF